MKRSGAVSLGLALAMGLPIGVAAETGVDFDFSNNIGFVTGSYVQSLLELNNGQMKKYIGGVSFPVSLESTAILICDGSEVDIFYAAYYDVIPTVIQSRGQITGFEFSGAIENLLIADPSFCEGEGEIDPGSVTTTKTLMVNFGGSDFILHQE